MQVTNPNNLTDTIIVTSQDTKSVSCELSNNGTLFDILSNSLYADKILAVIREILCNAWDSHIVSNKSDIPLEVTLNESAFIVKDFGSGIDPEKILQIYGTYGQSTKTNDEKQVGGFGIGSKAPFAYTDTFTVTNVHKNVKSVYILTKEPNQAPLIKTVYSDITDEPPGLTVSVVLKKGDLESFTDKLKNFMSKTDIKINLNGVLQENTDFSNTYCLIRSDSSYAIYVKYNSVAYKVSLDKIDNINSTFLHIVEDHSRSFIFTDIVLNTEPNTLDISATREALAYTKKTQDTVRLLCENFTQHITKIIENNIKDIYKDINTAKDYFKYVERLDNFFTDTKSISDDKEFIDYLVFLLTNRGIDFRVYQTKLKQIFNSIEVYRKKLFSKIFNIKLQKLDRTNLLPSLVHNLFPQLEFINTYVGKKKYTHYFFDKVPNKVYVITNKTVQIPEEQFNIKIPILLTSLKNKDNLINKLTDFGIQCIFVPSPKKEKSVVSKCKDRIYAKLVKDSIFNIITLEPNSYIIYKSREESAYDRYLRPYYYEDAFNFTKKIYEIYYKNDFNLLLKKGHIDLDKDIESGNFINNNFDVKFLNQTIVHSVNPSIVYNFQSFVADSEKNFELIKSKRWKVFFQKYKKNLYAIQFYNNYLKKNTDYFKKIISVKNNSAFNDLLKSGQIKKIIDYKKVNQYIIQEKIEPVIELLELIQGI
jgi:hypothetical protein